MADKENILPATVFLELRRRLIPVLLSFVVGFGVGIIFYKQILLFLLSLFDLKGINIVMTSSYQMFDLAFNVGIVLGLVILLPVFIYEFYFFVKPALRIKERKLFNKIIPFSMFLFVAGFWFGIKMTQYIFSFFSQTTADFHLGNYLDVSKMISQVLAMGLLTGWVFQIPLVISALMRMGIVKKEFLVEKRKIVWVILLIIAVLLPSTDVLSLVMITVPLVLLFELTLLLNK